MSVMVGGFMELNDLGSVIGNFLRRNAKWHGGNTGLHDGDYRE